MEFKIIDKNDLKKEYRNIALNIVQRKAKDKTTVMLTSEAFAQIFTKKRIDLLLELRKNCCASISDLARSLNRRSEVVYRDLKLLENVGLVKLEPGKGHTLVPSLVEEFLLRFPIAV